MTAPSMIDEAKKKAAKDALLNAYKNYEELLQKCRAVLTELKRNAKQEEKGALDSFELCVDTCEKLQKIMKTSDKSKYPIFLKDDIAVMPTDENLDDLSNKRYILYKTMAKLYVSASSELNKVYTKGDSRREAVAACLSDLYSNSGALQELRGEFERAAGPHEHVVEQSHSGPK
jgi:hypothetical protein